MPTLAWNKEIWDGDHSWDTGGEEWSAHWGSSEAQWFGSILPRIHRFFPCRRILEIGPGTGRWTRFLSAGCEEYVGIDLSAECVEACKRRFERVAHAAFYQNDGLSLEAAGKGPFNLIFSMDSLVHADADVMEAYVPQILALLGHDGAAFIHHSNFAASGAKENPHCRSEDVTADLVSALVSCCSGQVAVQEIINWGCDDGIDCLTTLQKMRHGSATTRFTNLNFMKEADLIRENQNRYCH